jgi:hypothetical protein
VRKRVLSDNELDAVIRLKESGASWLAIERQTAIPRRAAKRAYEQWQRTKSMEELKDARRDIAREEFREHMRDILRIAEVIAMDLPRQMLYRETRVADEVLDFLWRRELHVEEYCDYSPFGSKPEIEQRMIIRQSRLLFQSLLSHTREGVRWEVLEQWKREWNACINYLKMLHAEAREIVDNIGTRQKSEIKVRIQGVGEGKETAEYVASRAVEAVWRGAQIGELVVSTDLVRAVEADEGKWKILFTDVGSDRETVVKGGHTAEMVVKVCKWTVNNLSRGELAEKAARSLGVMRERAEELEEILNPLILRPLILRTRCEICPA